MKIDLSKKNFLSIGFILMSILVLFPSNVKSIIIALFCLSCVNFIYRKQLEFNPKFLILNSAIYIVLLFTFFYSSDLNYAINKMETMSSLIIFPLMFSFFSKCNTFISKGLILKKTLISFIIAVLILNTAFFLFFWVNEFSFIDTIKYFSYLVDHRFDKYSIHPIYLSIYLCLGILFSFHILQGSCNSRQRIFILILVLIQGLFLFVLNKKGPIISLFIGLSSIYLFKRDKVKTKYLLIFITGLILIGMLQKKKTISHFKELFKIENINKGNVTSTNIRYTIYLYSLEAVKSKPFLGYGIGDLNNTLMEIYEGQSDLLYKGKFNTHNQYLSFIVSSGVLGLIIFLLSIFFLFRNAIKKSNFLLVTVLIFYLCQMLSENILERENGVIFYSFFISFFQIIESKNST